MADLKAEAYRYWQMGLAVVPIKLVWDEEKKEWNKKPLCNWAKWQTSPQTLEEFEGFDWPKIEAFAVLLGKTRGGYYLCCLDVDKPEFDLTLLRTTRLEKTISGGFHAFYFSKWPVEGIKRHDLKLELLGVNNLVLVYPSKGYTLLNDSSITLVENASALFYELIAKIEGELKPEAEKQVQIKGVLPELLTKWLEQLKSKLDVANEGSKYISVHCPFHRPDRNPSFALHKQKYYAIDFHTGEVFSLKQLAEKLNVKLEGVGEAEEEQIFVETWQSQNLIEYVLNDLEKRVKKDKATKLSVFFTGLSAYLPEPINLFLKGESGIGKSYNVVQTLQYFPKEDVWFLGGLSPKALIHEHGQLLNKNGEPLDLEDKPVKPKKKDYASEEEYKEALKEYREELKAYAEEIRNSYTLIDLRHKILVFLESPSYETFRMLYPILSHDTEEIEYKFVDKSERGPLRTRRVRIRGWPASIFCTVDRQYMEELSTRSFTLTPEASKEKIEQANILTNLKASFPWEYTEESEESKTIKALIGSLKRQLTRSKTDVVIPFSNLYELFPKEITRDMRDFTHFTQFLKAITVLHFYQRPFMKLGDKRFIVSTVEDVGKALEIYSEVFETTRTGTEQRILRFYHEIVKTKEGWYLNEITAKYNELHKEKPLSSDTISLWLKRLSEIGYVDIQKDSEDKRLNVYRPLILEEEKGEIHRVLKNRGELSSKLEKGFKEWLTKYPKNTPFFYYKKISENTWGEAQISIEEASRIILGEASTEIFSSISNKGFFGYFSEPNLGLKTEKGFEEERKTEIRGISANSEDELKRNICDKCGVELGVKLHMVPGKGEMWLCEKCSKELSGNIESLPKGLFQCEFCKAQNRPMFFASIEDLKSHIRTFHVR